MTQNLYPENESAQSVSEVEETLRLVAQLPPPADLIERVHYRLKDAQSVPESRGFWSLWMPVQRLQYAGAALLVLAIAVSAWTVRHVGSGGPVKGPAPLQSSGQPVAQPIQSAPQRSGFVPAGSETRPSNLKPIKVPPAPKKKPSASKPLTRRTPKPAATTQAQSDSKSDAAPQTNP
jgi:hypothetical protein